jgi:hypothetical protein
VGIAATARPCSRNLPRQSARRPPLDGADRPPLDTYTIDTTVCEAEISGSYTINADGTGTDAVTFTSSSDGCTSGSYTQSLAIAKHGALVLLSNTNGNQINEEWYLQNSQIRGAELFPPHSATHPGALTMKAVLVLMLMSETRGVSAYHRIGGNFDNSSNLSSP